MCISAMRAVQGFISRDLEYIKSNRQYAMVSVMFVHLTIGGGLVGLVLVFAATLRKWRCGLFRLVLVFADTPKEMALRFVSFSSGLCRYA